MKRELIVTKRGVLVLTVVSIFITLYSFYLFYSININRNRGLSNLQRISDIQSSNAKLKLKLANAKYHYLITNYDDSLKNYINTLKLNPLLSRAWIGLCELLIDQNKYDQAYAILKHLKSNTPHAKLHWEIGLLFIRINKYDSAVDTLIGVAEIDIWKRDDVYKTINRLEIDYEDLVIKLNNVNLIPSYFQYLLKSGMVEQIDTLWNYIVRNNIVVDKDTKSKYIEFLIYNKMISKAFYLWSQNTKDVNVEDIFWNGDFEHELQNTGFDWRIQNTKDVEINVDSSNYYSGNKSLRLQFKGSGNLSFEHIKKYIPLKHGKYYNLSYAYSSRDITTKSGVFVELRCENGQPLATGDMILGSNEWTKHSINFSAGDRCSGMSLAIRRNPIRKLDSNISGTVWFDDFKLDVIN